MHLLREEFVQGQSAFHPSSMIKLAHHIWLRREDTVNRVNLRLSERYRRQPASFSRSTWNFPAQLQDGSAAGLNERNQRILHSLTF
jgi:hypothetical protein